MRKQGDFVSIGKDMGKIKKKNKITNCNQMDRKRKKEGFQQLTWKMSKFLHKEGKLAK